MAVIVVGFWRSVDDGFCHGCVMTLIRMVPNSFLGHFFAQICHIVSIDDSAPVVTCLRLICTVVFR